MKIGILTYHCVPNFGAQLQTLSTVCYLRNHGHEPIVLNWYPTDLEEAYQIRCPEQQREAHSSFAEKYFPLSKLCRSEKELIHEIDDIRLDAIILGSDAIFKYRPFSMRWFVKMGKYRPRIIIHPTQSVLKLFENPFWGGFISRLKYKIPVSTYAVSSQNCPYFDMNIFEKLFMTHTSNNFKAISVRDDWTKEMVETITGRQNIPVYPDPVFAFNQNCEQLIPKKEDILRKYNLPDNYILLCFNLIYCSKEYVESIAKQVKDNGFYPIELTTPEGSGIINPDRAIQCPLSPLDWYALIKYSNGYIGELMHAILVCLHNAVPFFSFDYYGVSDSNGQYNPKSSKIYHILSKVELVSNWHPCLGASEIPNPKNIVDRIIYFNKAKCIEFAKYQSAEYMEGMSNIVNTLYDV